MTFGMSLAERGILPDPLIRSGIRSLLRDRLREIEFGGDPEAQERWRREMIDRLATSPVAIETDAANRQHYELPPRFFELVLGRHLKYSSALFPPGIDDLDRAEEAMLDLTIERAEIRNGQRVLDLGCGWGSVSLHVARRFPDCRIVAVSNSAPQKAWIDRRCEAEGITNVEVVTADVNHFEPDGTFDRVISVEMFEHLRNYREIFRRVDGWLAPGGRVLIHVFAHRSLPYTFETSGDDDWMGRWFFTGGLMPSHDLFTRFQEDLLVDERWCVDGRHYQKTSEAWLERLDGARDEVLEIFAEVYGPDQTELWFQRWRIFFMACAELFGFRGGREWWVSHYRFRSRRESRNELPHAA